jgi:hypothetical protein
MVISYIYLICCHMKLVFYERQHIYKVKHKLPLKPCYRDGKHQAPHKEEKRVTSRSLVKILVNCLSILHGLSRSGFSHLCVSLSHEKLGFGLSIWHRSYHI